MSNHTERIGISIAMKFFESLGVMFRELPVNDNGIDAHIEIENSKNGTYNLIALQIKCGKSYLSHNSSPNYIFHFEERLYKYWTSYRLSKMQHYWCPTRLLDLTSNPLVALYFACCENTDEAGYFYIFKSTEVLNYDSDRALLLSCISHLNFTQQKSVNDFICNFINDKTNFEKYNGRITNEYISKIIKNQNNDEDGCFQFERLIGEVIRERSAFVNFKTVAKDLLKRYIVRPLIQNERQKKQEGLFLIFGLQGNQNIKVDNGIEVYCFEVNNKLCILKELDLLGINYSSIYCDIASRAQYLEKNKFKV